MKITKHFIEEFFTGHKDFELLGMKVLHLQILFRLNKGTIPIETFRNTFNEYDVEYFLGAKIISIDHLFAYDVATDYTEGGF